MVGPLAQLNAAIADRDGTQRVVETINGLLDDGTRLPAERVRRTFDRCWPELEARLDQARQVAAAPAVVPERSMEAKLDEVLEIARALQRSEGRMVIDTSQLLAGAPPITISPSSMSPIAISPSPTPTGMFTTNYRLSPVTLGNLGRLAGSTISNLPPGASIGPKQPPINEPSRSVRRKIGKPKKRR